MPEDAQQAIGQACGAELQIGRHQLRPSPDEGEPRSGLAPQSGAWQRLLAKAQAELVNPEKSLAATIRS